MKCTSLVYSLHELTPLYLLSSTSSALFVAIGLALGRFPGHAKLEAYEPDCIW